MTSFSRYLLSKKFRDINQSQESIETVSLWMLHHRKHAKAIVEFWASQFNTVSEQQKIAFLFLANEIIKTNKKKKSDFHEEFRKVLPDVFREIGRNFIGFNLIDRTHRILKVWRDHQLFTEETIETLWACLNENFLASPKEVNRTELDECDDTNEVEELFHTFKSSRPEDIIDVLETCGNFPSADKDMQDKIAEFSENLFDFNSIDALNNMKEAAEYTKNLEKAGKLVNNYKKRLELEMKQRQKLYNILWDYEEAERERIADIEKKLKTIKIDLEDKINVRTDLQRHREVLLDSDMYSNKVEIPPLPNADDLFEEQIINLENNAF